MRLSQQAQALKRTVFPCTLDNIPDRNEVIWESALKLFLSQIVARLWSQESPNFKPGWKYTMIWFALIVYVFSFDGTKGPKMVKHLLYLFLIHSGN